MAHLGSQRYDSAARQLERTAARTAAAARGVMGVVVAVAAALGALPPVSVAWLAPALAVELGWTALFLWRWWRGLPLPGWLVAGDVAVTVGLCLAQRHLVAAEALAGGASRVAGLVTVAITVPALGRRPPAGL